MQRGLIYKTAAVMLASSTALIAQSASAQVTLYEHCNFTGKAASLPVGNHNLNSLTARGAKNDDVSAIRVPRGYAVTIYEHAGFRGKSRTINSSTACLVNMGFNDIVSSVKVSRTGSTATNPRPTTRPAPRRPRIAPSNSAVIMYEDCNYRGNQTGISAGAYDLDILTRRGMRNDTVSGIKVKPGYIATVYQDAGFRGRSRTFTGSNSCLVNFGYNDIISSVRVTRQQTQTRPRPPVSNGNNQLSEISRLREELRKERSENERLRNTIRSLLGDSN